MYVPAHFEEPCVDVMRQLIRTYPLATVVTLSSHGLNANHIPLYLEAEEGRPHGVLRGHIARANPLWRDFNETVDALAIFQGPDAYITPSWYPSKKANGKVVPTWNYTTVHAQGPLRIIDDADWLRALLVKLTEQQERSFGTPWTIDDAPREYIDRMISAIVGIEIPIVRITGKWKVSQNQSRENQIGIVQALQRNVATEAMVDLIESKIRFDE